MSYSNNVTLVGTLADHQTSFNFYGETFHRMTLNVVRDSGTIDKLTIMFSDRKLSNPIEIIGRRVRVYGNIRTHNDIYVLAREIFITEQKQDENRVYLIGELEKEVNYRITPRGRSISDILLYTVYAVNKWADIPCVAWGSKAYEAYNELTIGSSIKIYGRLQSRVQGGYLLMEVSIDHYVVQHF